MAPISCIELEPGQQTHLLAIARESIVAGLVTKRPLPLDGRKLDPPLDEKLASFVTLLQRDELRGCVGSLEATHPLAEGIAIAAFNAAFRDRRFQPVTESEIDRTRIEISVLSALEPIPVSSEQSLIADLQPHVDGLLIEDMTLRATFLPKVWDHLPDPDTFLLHLKSKAGLAPDYWSDSIRAYRYRTTSFAEES